MKNWQKLRQHPELWQIFLVREQVFRAIREYFTDNHFHEVETPLLVEHPGTEPYLEVFETQLLRDGKTQPAFLLTSPEYAMKKLIVAGMHKIFQICKSFRNGEGESSRHNPEFTILEWYQSPGDYTNIMDDCEGLLQHIFKVIQTWKAKQSRGESKLSEGSEYLLTYQGKQYDLSTPWERISVAEAFQKYVGISADELLDEEKIKQTAAQKGYHVDDSTTWEQAYNQLLLNEIELHLGQTKPTILYDYPTSQAALSQPKKSDPRFAERFEFFLGGLELGNAFSELSDADEQEKRFT
jgi:lysyl-tRNA synthetase class 2